MTKLVPESIIEKNIQLLEQSEANFQEASEQFRIEQPTLFSFFFSENLSLLTQTEQKYLFRLIVIFWKSIKDVFPDEQAMLSEDQISEAEEHNWSLLEKTSAKAFHDRLDVLFEDSNQEDLLAFAEDMLTLEEQDELTKEGREPIFVALKVMADLLTKGDIA